MERWWYKEESGIGIVPGVVADPLRVGANIHADFAAIIMAPDPVAYVRTEIETRADAREMGQMEAEEWTRHLGWCYAYAAFVVPRILEDEEVVLVEHELVLERGRLWTACTPDLVTRRRIGGGLRYRELKTTAGAGPSWINHWPFAVQMHIGMAALRDEFPGETLSSGLVLGVEKGYEKEGALYHPYVRGYRRQEAEDQYQYSVKFQRGAGWEPFPTWEYPGGVEAWVVDLCGRAVAEEVFIYSAPIQLDDRQVESWVISRTAREEEVERVREACRVDTKLRLKYFPMHTENCRPVRGSKAGCAYQAACHNAAVNSDPLRSGLYKKREPHHQIERVAYGMDL